MATVLASETSYSITSVFLTSFSVSAPVGWFLSRTVVLVAGAIFPLRYRVRQKYFVSSRLKSEVTNGIAHRLRHNRIGRTWDAQLCVIIVQRAYLGRTTLRHNCA